MPDPRDDLVAAPVRSRSLARPVTITAAFLLAGALAGCGSSHANQPSEAPSQVANVDDSAVSIVTPPPTTAPPAKASDSSSTAATARQGATAAPRSSTGGTSTSGSATGPGGTTARTVPGVADGATALAPTATVAENGRCSLSALRLEPLDLQGSPGGTYANFRLVNVSGQTCAVRGYVGATLIGDTGSPMATSVRHEAGQDVWVKVAVKGSAQFHLRFANPMAGPTPCNPPNAAKVRVGIPGLSGTLTSATPEGGIQACNGQLSTAPIGST